MGGREATRGTVFTANDEEHTVVFRRSDICCSQTRGRLRVTPRALTENRLLGRLDGCLFYSCMHRVCVCVINRREVLGPDVEIT